MRKNIGTTGLAVIAAAVLVSGCDKMASPTAPTAARAPIAQGDFAIAGNVAGRSDAGEIDLGGAEVTLGNGNIGRTAVTDDEGNFEFEGIGGGDWTLTVVRPGYVTQTIQVRAGDRAVILLLDPTEAPPPARHGRAK
jgi:carboxypeptidase family protein